MHENADMLVRMEISTGYWSPSPASIPRMVVNHHPRSTLYPLESSRSNFVLFEMCSRIKNGTLRPSDPFQRRTCKHTNMLT